MNTIHIVIAVITLAFLLLFGCSLAEPVDHEELLHYPEKRGGIPVTVLELKGFGNFSRDGVTFPSKGTEIAADYYYPRNAKIGIVWIPAAGKTRRNAEDRGIAFASRGYAAMIVDVRGLGETTGQVHSFEDDYTVFSKGEEPYNHLVVWDALRAIDAMRERGVTCTLIGGESNGGRIALIAAAVDKTISGSLLISTAGYGKIDHQLFDVRRFLASINPDEYAPSLTNPIAFIHDTKDPTIPFSLGKQTYDKIAAPKKLYTLSNGCHGYCPTMDDVLTDALTFLAQKCK